MEENNDYFNNEPPRQKPHIIVRIVITIYAFLWFNMIILNQMLILNNFLIIKIVFLLLLYSLPTLLRNPKQVDWVIVTLCEK